MFHYRTALTASPLHNLIEGSADALAQAAELLAGRRGLCLVSDLIDGLASAPIPTRRILKTAEELLRVLSLDCVDDFDSEEAALFSSIDPWDPIVEDICLPTEALAAAIDATGELINEAGARKVAA